MRKFITTSIYQHGEQQATEQGTNKSFTLTQRKKITESDYYDITRFIAVEADVITVILSKMSKQYN